MRVNCKVEGCDQKSAAHGYCKQHLYRWQRYGDPLQFQRVQGEQMDWLKGAIASATPDACVEWPYRKAKGYGRVTYLGKDSQAHRVALILWSGVNPPDKQAGHGPCHNRGCVNPYHLDWITPAQNHADKERDGTAQKGVRHPRTQLTEADVRGIRDRRASGEIYRTIAADYGLTISAIYFICAGKTFTATPLAESPTQPLGRSSKGLSESF